MNLQTFKAPTMAEALGQVKSSMGTDAVILHTRTYHLRKWFGLRSREVVEITAGRGLNVGNSRPTRGRNGMSGSPQTAPVMRTASTATVVPATARDTNGNGQKLLETPAAGNAVILGLSQEVANLKAMLKDVATQVGRQKAPQVPEELFEHYLMLVQNSVDPDLAADIIKALFRQLRPEHMGQTDFVREKLAEQIEQRLPTTGPIQRTKTTGPHVVALIGPTGVGKTTTIAKLAANLKLREKHNVGLITIDTYRIAAIDQLKKYADIIGSPLRVVSSPEDLREAIQAMSECGFILIDTAGRSPKDTLKLNELKTFLQAAEPDEVHLVLSSIASAECVELAISRFEDVRADKLIFTKLDEAASVGTVLNVVNKVGKSLSYVTTGQDVPDDIEVARGRRLAQLILGNNL